MSIEPDAQCSISIGIWMGPVPHFDPRFKRSWAIAGRPRVGAIGQAAHRQKRHNDEFDSGEIAMRGHASGRTPQTSMMHDSPPLFHFSTILRPCASTASRPAQKMPPRMGFVGKTEAKS
jgi:hypothetical protein